MHSKAKDAPDYRFYALYDKIYRRDDLEFAYARCRVNNGAPGVEGQTFEMVEAFGLDQWLDELTEALRNQSVFRHPRSGRLNPGFSRGQRSRISTDFVNGQI